VVKATCPIPFSQQPSFSREIYDPSARNSTPTTALNEHGSFDSKFSSETALHKKATTLGSLPLAILGVISSVSRTGSGELLARVRTTLRRNQPQSAEAFVRAHRPQKWN
jgi:hypothetical protein